MIERVTAWIPHPSEDDERFETDARFETRQEAETAARTHGWGAVSRCVKFTASEAAATVSAQWLAEWMDENLQANEWGFVDDEMVTEPPSASGAEDELHTFLAEWMTRHGMIQSQHWVAIKTISLPPCP